MDRRPGAGTTTLTMATSSTSAAATAPRRWRQTFSADGERAWPMRREHAALAVILVLSGLLEFVRLSQNGYANVYYSAAVKSMLRSWHNFFSSRRVRRACDGRQTAAGTVAPGDQREDVRLLGGQPDVPEGICAVLAVALMYRIVAPRFGTAAGAGSAFTLAVFPSFVAVSRDNGLDPLLILLMLAACGAALAAIDSGRLRQLRLRRVRRPRVQHEGARRRARRPGDRARLPRTARPARCARAWASSLPPAS